MKIAVDFDGTIVEHEFPRIGKPVPGAFEWMKKWQDAGAKLILWTMRCNGIDVDKHGNPVSQTTLSDAVEFCYQNGIEFDGVNEGLGDREWTNSPKAHAHIYVDDAAFGCPLINTGTEESRPYVDWNVVGPKVLAELTQTTDSEK